MKAKNEAAARGEPRRSAGAPGDLAGYEVVVAVCGGISAYKVAQAVSTLVQRGAGVTAAMTRSARKFVGPTTFGALTGRPVLTNLWASEAYYDPQHVRLTEALDALLIAPATYNVIGKVAAGIADDLVTTLVAAAACPVILAPAMNTRMWENPICLANVRRLTELGYTFVPPGQGWLACRTVGAGRMAEAGEIIEVVVAQLRKAGPKGMANVE